MKARDVLAYHMHVHRPPLRELPAGIRETHSRDVIGKCVEPDVRRLRLALARVAREGNTPSSARATRGHVFQPLIDQRQYLVRAASRLQKISARNQRPQSICVRAQSEE